MKIFVDTETKMITLGGVNYAFELFETLGVTELGSVFEVIRRDDNAITLRRIARDTPRSWADGKD